MTISIKVPANNSRLLLLASKFLSDAAQEQTSASSTDEELAFPRVPTMSVNDTYDTPPVPANTTLHEASTVNGTMWEPGDLVPPPPAPAPNNVDAEERDINGVIWKSEFHAATKSKTIKEIWKLRKGMTDAEKVAAQEYIALFAGREVTPPAPAAQVTPPAPAATTVTFPELMAKVNELNMAGTMSADQITELVKSMGFDGLGKIINEPTIISQLMATLQNV